MSPVTTIQVSRYVTNYYDMQFFKNKKYGEPPLHFTDDNIWKMYIEPQIPQYISHLLMATANSKCYAHYITRCRASFIVCLLLLERCFLMIGLVSNDHLTQWYGLRWSGHKGYKMAVEYFKGNHPTDLMATTIPYLRS